MTTLAHSNTARAERYSATRYDAFRVVDFGSRQKTYAVNIDGFLIPTVDAARDCALLAQAFAHKDHLIVRETGEDGVRLHVFAIKKRARADYVLKDHVEQRVQRLYADPVCVIDGGVLGAGL